MVSYILSTTLHNSTVKLIVNHIRWAINPIPSFHSILQEHPCTKLSQSDGLYVRTMVLIKITHLRLLLVERNHLVDAVYQAHRELRMVAVDIDVNRTLSRKFSMETLDLESIV